MAEGSQAEICVSFVGLGIMGCSLVKRLLSSGRFRIYAWNRTLSKAESLKKDVMEDETLDASKLHICSSLDALLDDSPATIFCCMFSTFEQTKAVLAQTDKLKQNKTLLTLCSGSPLQSKEFGGWVHERVSIFVDGTYCGGPDAARAGSGTLYLSSDTLGFKDLEQPTQSVMRELGEVCFVGKLGSNKALDYGVVDFYFMNLICLLNAIGMAEKEDVSLELLVDEAEKRVMKSFKGFKTSLLTRLESREYSSEVTASLKTCDDFVYGERLKYLKESNCNTSMSTFFHSLVSSPSVSDSMSPLLLQHDISRLQEVLRFNRTTPPPSPSSTSSLPSPPSDAV